MAFPTAVNDQITDSVSQANVNVLGDAPAVAMGSLYQTAASAAGLAIENAVANQQQLNIIAEAVTTSAVESLLQDSLSGQNNLNPDNLNPDNLKKQKGEN